MQTLKEYIAIYVTTSLYTRGHYSTGLYMARTESGPLTEAVNRMLQKGHMTISKKWEQEKGVWKSREPDNQFHN